MLLFDNGVGCELVYLGHKNVENGTEQTLKEHLNGVSKLAENFASEFGENEIGKIAGLYHDIGKYSKEFQKYIRQESKQKVDHSTAGARELFKVENHFNFVAAFCISGHHGGIPDAGNPLIQEITNTTFFSRIKFKKIPNYDEYTSEIESPSANNKSKLIPLIAKEGYFSMMFYTRMIFSCLVDADFLDTENFMSNKKISRGNFETLNKLKIELESYIETNFYNKNSTRYGESINERRRKILEECISIGSNTTENLLSLTVPTGGGKTISSMAFALYNAVKNGKKRIIYVIPYTSIIEQTAKIFSGIFDTEKENVIEHHSGAEYEDAESEKENIKKLATENWDAPIIVTTNVQFFESLFSNRTSKCRKLHNIANSVIIFDEAQMIPTEFLKPCVYTINELTKHYNCTAVLCTATQPSLEKLFENRKITEICSEIEKNYNFFRRTKIKVLEKNISAEKLTELLQENRQVLCIVNKKKTAIEIFENFRGKENIFYLTTNLCPIHRSEVLQKIKLCLGKNRPCKVISTSLVEAGVDLDFPCVYREIAGIDSIIQAAGRCNREGKFPKDESLVYVFTLENEKPVQNQNMRISAANLVREKYIEEIDSLQAIKYYFDCLHKWKDNDKTDGLDKERIKKLCTELKFKEIAEKFKLIDENTKAVFIPYDETARQIEINMLNSRTLLREATKYVVNVYYKTYEKMLSAQKIKLVDESLAVLVDLNLYDQYTGLNLEIEEGIGIFF